jgi:hypothetical protein
MRMLHSPPPRWRRRDEAILPSKKKGGVQNRVNYHLKGEEMKGEYNCVRLLLRYATRNVKSVFGIKINTIIYANM